MALAAVGCATNPATGERELSLVSESQEIAMGKAAAEEVRQTVGLYDAPALQQYVSEIGQRLAASSERPDLPWAFAVVDDPAVNAFALPGGFIYVTRGLLAHLENEAQLVAVLGHEIGHVTARHSANRITKAQLATIGLGIGILLSEDVRRWAPLGTTGLGLLFLKFSRDDEREADRLAFRYALRGGYDVRQIPDVFATFDRISQQRGEGRLPEWLATHPDPANRVQSANEVIAQLDLTGARKVVDRAEYLRTIDGMVYGRNPRQGITRGQTFYQPAMQYSIKLPEGWHAMELERGMIATSPGKDAVLELSPAAVADPQAALRAFAAGPGVQRLEPGAPARTDMPSASAWFSAMTRDGQVGGRVTFLQVGGRSFQLLSIAPAAGLSAYRGGFDQTHASFERLTDQEILNVKPARLQIRRIEARTSLRELHQQSPAARPIEEIALLNDVTPDAVIEAGGSIKWVR